MRYERWVVDAPSFGPLDHNCGEKYPGTVFPSRDRLFAVIQFFLEILLALSSPEVIPDKAAKPSEEVAVA